jgi:hypothetical protein
MGVDLFDKTVVSTYDAIIKVGDNDTITSSAKRLSDGRGNDTAIWLSTTNMGVNAAPTAGYTLTVNGNILGTKIDATTFQILGGTGTQGTITWNTDENTADLIQNGTTLQVGQQVEVHVKNQTLATIPKGTPVYVTGTLGASGRLTVAPFIADGSIDGKFFLGVTAEDIINGEDGKLLTFGKIRGLDTSAYSEGQTLFISDTVAGEFQTTAPTSPSLVFEIAIVINSSATNGTIFIRTGGTASAGSTLQEVTDNGNTTTNSIGIGTTPASGVELHVKDSVGNAEIRIEQSDVDTAYGILRFAGDDPSGSKYIIAYNSNDAFQPNEISLKNALGDITFHNGTAGAVERVRIDASTGNVGIGTTSVNASAKLHVKDDDGAEIRIEDTTSTTFETLRFVGDASTYEKYIVGYNSGNVFSANDLHLVNAGGDIVFRTETAGGGTERVRITDTGNVGIGTTSPLTVLDVTGDIHSTTGLRIGSAVNGTTGQFLTDGTNTYLDYNGFLSIRRSASSAESVRIDANSNVGIGITPNAAAKLHVKDDDGAEIRIEDNTSTTFETLRFVGDASTFDKGLTGYNSGNLFDANALHLYNTAGDIVFRSSTGGGTGTERVRIDAVTGNIGIGTTSPSHLLHLSKTSYPNIRIDGGAVQLDAGLDTGANTAVLGTNSNHSLLFKTNGSEKVRIDPSGNMLIGDSTYAGFGQLQIGNASTTTTRLQMISSPSVGSGGIHFGDTTSATNARFAGFLLYDHNGDFMRLGTAEAERMRIDSSGSIIIQNGQIEYPNAGDLTLNSSNVSGEIQFRTAGNERMRIASNGNVGIGTTIPTGASGKTLAINGGAGQTRIALKNNFTGDAAGDGFQILLDTGGGFIEMRENLPLAFTTNNTERVRIDASGRVGIGTPSPAALLHLNGGDMYVDGVSGSAFSHSIIFRTNSTAEDVGIRSVGEGFEVYEPEDSNKVWFRILDDPATNTAAALLNSPTGLTPVISDYNKGDYINKTYIDSLNIDADTLDGFDSSQFIRDSGTFSGTISGDSAARIVLTNTSDASLSSTGHALQIGITASTNLIFDNDEIMARNNGSTSPLYIQNDGGNAIFGGSVGVGLTTLIADALFTLHNADVDLEFSIDNAVANTARLLCYDRGAGVYRDLQFSAANILFNIAGSERARIDSSGRVGIGTTAPTEKLHVSGALRSTGATTSNTPSATIGWNNASNYASFESRGINDTTRGEIALYQANANGSGGITSMYINTAGNVGIGTTSPNGKFTTVGTYATVTHSLAANSAISISSMGVDGDNFNAFSIGQANSQNNSAVMRFKYNGAGSTSNYAGFGFYANDDILNIKADGKVGIGTTSPSSKLTVDTNINSSSPSVLKLQNSGLSGAGDLEFGISAGTGAYASGAALGTVVVRNNTTGGSVIIGAKGTVKIGVGGADFDTRATFDSSGNLSVTGDVIGYSSSDKALKDNIKPIENALEKIDKIGGYEFDWNDNQDAYKGHDIGVIAQEIEEVIPEIVTTRDNGYKAVKYEKLTPLLIQAIKEQQEQIEDLKAKVERLIATR